MKKSPLYFAVCFFLVVSCTDDQTRSQTVQNENAVKSTTVSKSIPPQYVGRKTCVECHAEQEALWRGSHHDMAMHEANKDTVLGDFNNADFTYAGITSTFSQKDGKYFVKTDNKDGELQEFEIQYTFGVTPLQ